MTHERLPRQYAYVGAVLALLGTLWVGCYGAHLVRIPEPTKAAVCK